MIYIYIVKGSNIIPILRIDDTMDCSATEYYFAVIYSLSRCVHSTTFRIKPILLKVKSEIVDKASYAV